MSEVARLSVNCDTYNHFLLEEGKNLVGRGWANGHFKNQGHVIGDGIAPGERIVFGPDWIVLPYNNIGGPGTLVARATDASVIPEPSTLVIWSLLGGIGITVGRWRRRKAA